MKTQRPSLILVVKHLMKRNSAPFHYTIMIGFGAVFLCLLPISLTRATSRDVASVLSSPTSFTETPPAFKFTHNDDILAALTIYLEARGESFAGKMAVAAVIRNRMSHKYQSDGTVKGTVLRAKQFEPWIRRTPEDLTFNPNNRKMQESLLAWNLVQDGRNVVDGAVLFYNPQLVRTPKWARVYQKVAKIGGHAFFIKHNI